MSKKTEAGWVPEAKGSKPGPYTTKEQADAAEVAALVRRNVMGANKGRKNRGWGDR